MRLWRLTAGDIRFQFKYGFYALYAIFTAVYMLALAAVPQSARRTVATVMIFSDPAAMGLFFMGAIILLEKSQRINCALSASPVREWEYMLSKLISLAFIGLIVGAALAIAGGIPDIIPCLVAIALSSMLCSACGLIVAIASKSLNQFIILAVPFELIVCLPPIVLLFNINSPWLMLHPGIAAVWLIYGEAPSVPLCLLSLIAWIIPAMLFCRRSIARYFQRLEGGDK